MRTPARPARRVATLAGLAFGLVAAVGVVAHFRSPYRAPVLGVSAFAPYLMLAAPLALLLLAAARRWVAAVVAAALCAVWVLTQAPLYGAAAAPSGGPALSVMTLNLRLGLASPQAVVGAVRRHHVQVLMLEELSAAEQARLGAAGLDRLLPYHLSETRPDQAAAGTGLWSSYPLRHGVLHHEFAFAFVTAEVAVPGVARRPLAVALHMAGPWPDSTLWNSDIRKLRPVLRRLAQRPRSLVVGGDLNATPDIAQFRALLTDGIADGAAQAGAGVTATYPADHWFGPLIAIDHVLTHSAVVTAMGTVQIEGTDHRALVARVALPS